MRNLDPTQVQRVLVMRQQKKRAFRARAKLRVQQWLAGRFSRVLVTPDPPDPRNN